MQTDLEATFGQLLSSIVSIVQDALVPIQSKVEEYGRGVIVTSRMRSQNAQRTELSSHLENAEKAIASFYQCLEGRT